MKIPPQQINSPRFGTVLRIGAIRVDAELLGNEHGHEMHGQREALNVLIKALRGENPYDGKAPAGAPKNPKPKKVEITKRLKMAQKLQQWFFQRFPDFRPPQPKRKSLGMDFFENRDQVLYLVFGRDYETLSRAPFNQTTGDLRITPAMAAKAHPMDLCVTALLNEEVSTFPYELSSVSLRPPDYAALPPTPEMDQTEEE